MGQFNRDEERQRALYPKRQEIPVKRFPNPRLQEGLPGIYMVMGETAEVVAKRYKISREAQDEYALASQQRTASAQQDGFFTQEIAPIDHCPLHTQPKVNEKACTPGSWNSMVNVRSWMGPLWRIS